MVKRKYVVFLQLLSLLFFCSFLNLLNIFRLLFCSFLSLRLLIRLCLPLGYNSTEFVFITSLLRSSSYQVLNSLSLLFSRYPLPTLSLVPNLLIILLFISLIDSTPTSMLVSVSFNESRLALGVSVLWSGINKSHSSGPLQPLNSVRVLCSCPTSELSNIKATFLSW